ncbi:MAG: fimbrillin family protein [Alistipes sp.]|nr:fimbrillin family protein [Alistipes sp.]
MKKILFVLCAMATFASCSNEEIVNFDKEAIAFDGAFVDNGTRAADSFTIETNELFDFNVWATTQRPKQNEVEQPIVPILNEVIVCRPDLVSDWVYPTANTQYWIPGNTYQFVAAKNYGTVTLANGVPSKFTYDATTQLDLLYAADTRVGVEAGANAAVAFTFDHLLTKAYFSVDTNQMSGANANYTYRVSDLRITNAVKNATYDVASKTWTGTANYTAQDPLEFNDVNGDNKLAADGVYTSDDARLLIPASYTDLNITCTIETLYGDSVIDVQNYNKTIAQEFVKGYVYNFVMALKDPGQPIEFTVTRVNEWIKSGDANGNTEIPGL